MVYTQIESMYLVLHCCTEIGWGGKDSIHLAQDREQWRALVNTVMSLQIP
jgi:hypothetical protein